MKRNYFTLLCGLFMLSGLALLNPTAHAAPDLAYIVNTSNDVNDTACNAAHCSLREAINATNAHVGLDTINFEIGGCPCIIYPLAVLPPITDTVIINGYTEDGALPADSDDDAVIKVTVRGTHAPNFSGGLRITGGNTTIKGLAINDFDSFGIWLSGGGNNIIEGNFIGIFASGLNASSNAIGILVSHGSGYNVIGGIQDATRNLVSGNTVVGIYLSDQGGGADHNVISGNVIGEDKNGDPLGNGVGIHVRSKKNLIGSDLEPLLLSNTIAGNIGAGIELDGPAAKGNIITKNLIGSGDNGGGNGTYGVLIHNGARKNKVGKPPKLYNYFINNGADAIAVIDDNSKRNSIRANLSYNSGGLGIDLGDDSVTPNDALDADIGPNNRQNFPVLKKANATTHRVKGKMVGKPNTLYKIDLYQPIVCLPLGYGEGAYVGSISVTTDATGLAQFSEILQLNIDPQFGMTATATDVQGNTSEFSKCISVTP